MNETLKVLESRRSCRSFKPDMIKKEELDSIIKAGTYAANGMGQQSPVIIAVTSKELRDSISEENRKIGGWDEGFDPFYGAPVILIVLADKSMPTYVYDGALVMGNLMNAAEDLVIKPYLRPLSNLTQEERNKFCDIGGVISYRPTDGKQYIDAFVPEALDYLNSIHADYRGLIEKGLAIEVTEENNPYK